jgi:hypothetical protein
MSGQQPSATALKQQVAEKDAELEALRAEVQALREQAVAPDAPADIGDKLAGAFEKLAERIEDISRPKHEAAGLFTKPGESTAAIWRSLDKAISAGVPLEDGTVIPHSGKYTERPVTFKQLNIRNGVGYLNVIRKARARTISGSGEPVVTQGVHYNFGPNGEFTTDDKNVVEFLKGRPGFGSVYAVLGDEPGRAPDAGPVLDEIMDCQANYDIEGLDRIAQQERRTHKRDIVLKTADAAKKAVRRHEAQLLGQQREERGA